MQSVFRPWIEDSPYILKKCLEFDLKYWKGLKFIKDSNDYKKVIQIIADNYQNLKLVYINLSSFGSHYPFIGWNDFATFCREQNIQDKNLQQQTIDRMFIATKVRTELGSKVQLSRHDFLEVLVRIAEKKYYTNNYADSLQILISFVIKYKGIDFWQEFRDDELWCTLTDRLFKINEKLLKLVYNEIFPKYYCMGPQSCIDFIINRTNLKIADQEIKYIYAMSKMSMIDMVTNIENFQKLKYVEFLEFLGRLGQKLYKNEPELHLEQKCIRVLDEVLLAIKKKRIIEYEVIDVERSSSEESCFVDQEQLTSKINEVKGYQFISRYIL